MHYIVWLFRISLFVALMGFAVKNDQTVTLRYFLGYEWSTPLVVALLCFFAIGAVVGILAMLGTVMRQKRELSAAQRELQLKPKLEQATEDSQSPEQPS